MKRILVLPDVHLTEDVPKEYKIVKKFMKDFKPDETIILGDFMDVAALSHWDLDKKRKIEGKRYEKEVKVANRELDYIQLYSKKVTYLEGNHENFVERYLDRNPELEGMIEIPLRLDLEGRGIKWFEMNDLYKIGHVYFTHGFYTNKYHAHKHLMSLGCNIVYGHTHNTQTALTNMKMQKPIMGYGLGCLCGHDPDYMKGRPSNWMNQFAVMYLNEKNGQFNIYPINIVWDSFIFNGREYK